jgi:lysozyme
MMKTSNAGLDLIMHYEGVKLTAYQDSVGIWTIGIGHTGPDVKQGQTITEAQALELLQDDVQTAEDCIDALVNVDLSQGQFDALVSFVFNLGCKAFKGSTLLSMVNAGRFQEAAKQFDRWCHAGGVVLAGLQKRRAAEEALFLA